MLYRTVLSGHTLNAAESQLAEGRARIIPPRSFSRNLLLYYIQRVLLGSLYIRIRSSDQSTLLTVNIARDAEIDFLVYLEPVAARRQQAMPAAAAARKAVIWLCSTHPVVALPRTHHGE